ncbi:hypothetical protein C9928_06005, partial [Pseudidiomarina aestuarii]
MSNLSKTLLLLCLLAAQSAGSTSLFDREVDIYTAEWAPYIDLMQSRGDLRELVEIALVDVGIKANWQQLNYYHSFQFIEQNKITAAFPYFKTVKRAERVIFSDPVFFIENAIFYDRVRYPNNFDIEGHTAAVVGGYSYGENIDALLGSTRTFANDQQALRALFNGEVDFVPMSSHVAEALTLEYFPNQYHRLAKSPQYSSASSVHLIAPKTVDGQAFMDSFNRGLVVAKKLVTEIDASIDANIFGRAGGIVSLNEADGYPIVTAIPIAVSASSHSIYLVPG